MRSVLFALLLTTALPACKKASPLTPATDTKFKVGQRWSYWARPGEESSTFTIEKIESHPTWGVIVHVGLDNLKLHDTNVLPHLVFSRDAIDKSAAKLIDDNAPIPPYVKDYEAWKKQVDDGRGSILETPIAQALDAMDK